MKRLVLIDGSGYIFRAFYALPPMSRSDGVPVNAVYGFTNMLLRQVEDMRDQTRTGRADVGLGDIGLAVVFDAARRTFRNDLHPDYKANRSEPPEDLVPQFSLIKKVPAAFNVASLEQEGFEADDLIATYVRLARAQGTTVTIVSSDKDLMQLVGEGVAMYDPVKSRHIGPQEVREKFGVGPEKVVDVQALAGDASDNVPGVPGIGIKTASQLIDRFGTLESLLTRAQEIEQPKRRQSLVDYAAQARLSRDLVHLRTDAPTPRPLQSLTLEPLDPANLLAFLDEQGFKTIAARVRGLHENRVTPERADTGLQQSASDKGGGAALAQNAPPHPGSPDTVSGSPRVGIKAGPGTVNYVLVQEEADLRHWVEKAEMAGAVAIDTETTGLDPMRAELVGLSLSVEDGHACYIPLAHKAPGQGHLLLENAEETATVKQIERARALEILKPVLVNASVLKIGHNLKYDSLVLSHYGIAVSPIEDTMALSYALDAGQHGHGLDELAGLWLDHKTTKYAEVAGSGKSRITFDRVDIDTARDYAAEDADMALRLYAVFKPRLVAEGVGCIYETLERPLIDVLVAMEKTGIKVDAQVLSGLSERFSRTLNDLSAEIYRLAGQEFTIGSPKQLGDILFDQMGLPGGKKGKAGAYATGAGVLEGLADLGHDLPARVLDWRQLSKLKSTYTDALVKAIHPQTGRVHTSFSMASAATGRLSSTGPNLQNIPIRGEEGRKIRGAFIAEPGHVLLSVDYSQIELRLLAHCADIPVLKQAFHDGKDIHALTAARIFGVGVDGVSPTLRRRAKAINFGIIYGISAFGLAKQIHSTREEAQRVIDTYLDEFSGVRGYMEHMKDLCRKQGYVRTLFGRKVHIPGINDKNPARRGFSERAAINAPLQGTAADIIKRAMIRLHHMLPARNLGARMLLQVHDELIFEVPVGDVEDAATCIRSVMEDATRPALTLSVPLVCDVGWGKSWDAAH